MTSRNIRWRLREGSTGRAVTKTKKQLYHSASSLQSVILFLWKHVISTWFLSCGTRARSTTCNGLLGRLYLLCSWLQPHCFWMCKIFICAAFFIIIIYIFSAVDTSVLAHPIWLNRFLLSVYMHKRVYTLCNNTMCFVLLSKSPLPLSPRMVLWNLSAANPVGRR